jgi:hypothetical protein
MTIRYSRPCNLESGANERRLSGYTVLVGNIIPGFERIETGKSVKEMKENAVGSSAGFRFALLPPKKRVATP